MQNFLSEGLLMANCPSLPHQKILILPWFLIAIYSGHKILYCPLFSLSNWRYYFLGLWFSMLCLEDSGYLTVVCFWNLLFASAPISSLLISHFFLVFFTVLLFSHIFNSFDFLKWSLWVSDSAICCFCWLLFLMLCFFGCFMICVYELIFLGTVGMFWGLGRTWTLLEVICLCFYQAPVLCTPQLWDPVKIKPQPT